MGKIVFVEPLTHREVSIARVCHEANRGLCLALGDESQVSWEEAADWQQASAIAGVRFALKNPDATPESLHEAWVEQKVAEGWVYGETKDPEQKTHPSLVPYDELPGEQKAKDHVFLAVVNAMR